MTKELMHLSRQLKIVGTFLTIAAVVTTRASGQSLCGGPAPYAIERVSLSDLGTETHSCTAPLNCKNNSHPTISDDGNRVAFDSDASDILSLVPNPQFRTQVYVRDVAALTTSLISTPTYAPGTLPTPGNQPSGFARISGDGNHVAFATHSDNLVANDSGAASDLFLHTISTSTTERISEFQNSNGQWVEFNGDSGDGAPSWNGDVVAFSTWATNPEPLFYPGTGLPAAIPVGFAQEIVLVKVRATGTFELISAPAGGLPNGPSRKPMISADGRFVVFESNATNLTGSVDHNGTTSDIFVCDRTTGVISGVSVTPAGSLRANGLSRKPGISGSGRYVCFESMASNLLPANVDNEGNLDVFVRDLVTNTTVRVSVSDVGKGANQNCGYSTLSGDGRYVMFCSTATNLDPSDYTTGFLDSFVHDRDVSGDGTFDQPGDTCTRLVSRTPAGVQTNAKTGGNCALSATGQFGVFNCQGNTLAPNDFNGGPPGNNGTALYGRDIYRVQLFP